MTTAEEHLVSEAVRSRLGHLLADAGGGVHGVAVLACAPGERHELGLMMATIALRRDGWKVVYLGADAPLADALALCGGAVGACARAERRDGGARDGLEAVLRGGRAGRRLARRRRRGRDGRARPQARRRVRRAGRSAAPFRPFAPSRRSLRA